MCIIDSPEDIKPEALKAADYLGLGPFAETSTKISNNKSLGLEGMQTLLNKLRAISDLPAYAIGGIRAEHTKDILNLGFHGVAVSSAVLRDENPSKSTESFLKALC